MKRQRGRGRNNNKPQNPNRALESNGPGVKVRGAASTVYEKYQQLARDASLSGDRIMAENYLQFAEHYFRIMREQQLAREQREEGQVAQRAARKAEYEARKAQQERAAPPAMASQNQNQNAASGQEAAPSGNGAGPMDVVTPQTEQEIQKPKPVRAPRRRVRRAAASADAAPQALASAAGADETPSA